VELTRNWKSYDSIFKNLESMNKYLIEEGLINYSFHSSVYIVGDFTASHDGALEYLSQYEKSLDTWNGEGIPNQAYNGIINNCGQVAMKLLFKGVLPSGTPVWQYAYEKRCWGTAFFPNANLRDMQNIFYNDATNRKGFNASMEAQRDKYEGRSGIVQWWYGWLRKDIETITGR